MQHNSTWAPTAEEIVEHNAFLRLMAHDVRTPLNAILGFSELAVNPAFGELTDQQREFIDSIADGARQLADLIPNVIELSEWPAKPNTDPTALGNLVESVVALATRTGRKRQVAVDFLSSDESLKDEQVPKALRRLLYLLMSRSVAACSVGATITLTLSRTPGLALTSIAVSESGHDSHLPGWEDLCSLASELGWTLNLPSDSRLNFELVAAMDGYALMDEHN